MDKITERLVHLISLVKKGKPINVTNLSKEERIQLILGKYNQTDNQTETDSENNE